MRLWNTLSTAWSTLSGRAVPGLQRLVGTRRLQGTFTGTTRSRTRRGSVQLEESSWPGIAQDGTLEVEVQVPPGSTRAQVQVQGSHVQGGTLELQPDGERTYRGSAELGADLSASLELSVDAKTLHLRYWEEARCVRLLTDQSGFDPPEHAGQGPASEETSVQVSFEASDRLTR